MQRSHYIKHIEKQIQTYYIKEEIIYMIIQLHPSNYPSQTDLVVAAAVAVAAAEVAAIAIAFAVSAC